MGFGRDKGAFKKEGVGGEEESGNVVVIYGSTDSRVILRRYEHSKSIPSND